MKSTLRQFILILGIINCGLGIGLFAMGEMIGAITLAAGACLVSTGLNIKTTP